MALVWYITKFLFPPFVKPLQDNSNKRIFFVYRFFIPWLSKLLLISWHDCHFLLTDFLTVYLCLYDSYGRQSMWEWVEFTWKTSFISARLGSCHTESCLRTWTVHVGTCSASPILLANHCCGVWRTRTFRLETSNQSVRTDPAQNTMLVLPYTSTTDQHDNLQPIVAASNSILRIQLSSRLTVNLL